MGKIRFVTDSTSDYTQEEAQRLGIDMVCLRLYFDGIEYIDGVTISKEEFYHKLVDEHKYPKTAQATVDEFEAIFKDAKENGDDVIVTVISSGLSGTINSANIAKENVEYDRIHIIDSKTTVGGLRILVETGMKLVSEGKNVEEVVSELTSLTDRIQLFACMNTLEYLHKGGRLSGVGAMIGGLINLKPIISFDEAGKVKISGKPIGKVRANKEMIKLLQSNPIDTNYPVYYYYSQVEENLTKFIGNLQEQGMYVEGINVNLSPVVGCHIGDKCYGLIYVRK